MGSVGWDDGHDFRSESSVWRTRIAILAQGPCHAIAVGLTIAISVLVIAALALVLAGGHIANFVGARLGWVAVTAWKILQWPAALFFVILAFSLIYYYAPNVKQQHWYWITPGSVVGVFFG